MRVVAYRTEDVVQEPRRWVAQIVVKTVEKGSAYEEFLPVLFTASTKEEVVKKATDQWEKDIAKVKALNESANKRAAALAANAANKKVAA